MTPVTALDCNVFTFTYNIYIYIYIQITHTKYALNNPQVLWNKGMI